MPSTPSKGSKRSKVKTNRTNEQRGLQTDLDILSTELKAVFVDSVFKLKTKHE